MKKIYILAGLTIVLTLFATTAHAITLPAYFYGNGEEINDILNGVAMVVQNSDYRHLLAIAFLFGLIIAAYLGMTGTVPGLMTIARYYWWAIVGMVLLVRTTATVNVYDEITGFNNAVDNVPLAVALPLSTTTTTSKILTQVVDTAFGPLDATLRYGNVGFMQDFRAFKLTENGIRAAFKDSCFIEGLSEYYRQCIVPKNIYEGTRWQEDPSFLNGINYPIANVVDWKENDPVDPSRCNIVTLTCQTAYQRIVNKMNTLTSTLWSQIATKAKIGASTDISKVQNVIQKVAEIYLNSAQSANVIAQNVILFKTYDAYTQTIAAAHGYNILLGEAIAETQQVSAWTIGGVIADKYLPVFRMIMLGLVIAIFPVVALLFVTGFSVNAAKYYLGLWIWLAVWDPFAAIIHNTYHIYLEHYGFGDIKAYTTLGLIYPAAGAIFAEINSVCAMAGWFAVLVPALASLFAFSMLKLGGGAISGAAGGFVSGYIGAKGAMATSGIEGAARTAATGGAMERTVYTGMDYINYSAAMAATQAVENTARAWTHAGLGTDTYTKGVMGNTAYSTGRGSELDFEAGQVQGALTRSYAEQLGIWARRHSMSMRDAISMFQKVQVSKAYEDARAFTDAATSVRMDVNDLAYGMATWHHMQMAKLFQTARDQGWTIEDLAAFTGHYNALKQIGNTLGYSAIEYIQGTSGVTRMHAAEIMNVAAKFTNLSRIAQALGVMKSPDDWQGLYHYLQHHHGHDVITLSTPMAQKLNEALKDMGIKNASFAEGDKVSIGFNPETGKITFADAQRGARLAEFDLKTAEMGRRVGKYDMKRTEIGEITEVHDKELRYTGGIQTTYSPAQQAAYSLFKGTLIGMGMSEEQAEKYAVKAVASGYWSAREGKFFGHFITDPRALLAASTLQGIDITHKLITDPDYKMVGNPLNVIKEKFSAEVTPKLGKIPEKIAEKMANLPIIKQYHQEGLKLGEAIRNNDVKTVASIKHWTDEQAKAYIEAVHRQWDSVLHGKEEPEDFDFGDSINVLFPKR